MVQRSDHTSHDFGCLGGKALVVVFVVGQIAHISCVSLVVYFHSVVVLSLSLSLFLLFSYNCHTIFVKTKPACPLCPFVPVAAISACIPADESETDALTIDLGFLKAPIRKIQQ